MRIFDSSSRQEVEFVPIKKGEVRIYVCGPTVYDDAHLGHARSSIVFDLLVRVLRKKGFRVTFMKNFTDIDDKIVKKVLQTGKSLKEITTHYIKSYLEDMEALGVQRADLEPKATENLEAMFDMIDSLLKKGCAYATSKGDIYFDTSKDPLYCSLSNRCSEERVSRIETDPEKKNVSDFALWKTCKEEDLCFDSPFGKGRPGWHIECSAMIKKSLAYENEEFQIDIHGGGADLLFPHHENEAAQTRCACGQKLAKYWMHNGFVTVSGEKMSKSLGNSFFVKDALKHYDGEILRFYLLSTHYRSELNFNEEDLLNSKKRLDKIYRLKKRIYPSKASNPDKEFERSLIGALEEDLNISKALAVIDDYISISNERLDKTPSDKNLKRTIAASLETVDHLLGVGSKDPFKYFQLGIDEKTKEKIERLISQRSQAKKERDYEKADRIREELKNMGISIMDTPSGTLWERV